jgi:hypothetical protein
MGCIIGLDTVQAEKKFPIPAENQSIVIQPIASHFADSFI